MLTPEGSKLELSRTGELNLHEGEGQTQKSLGQLSDTVNARLWRLFDMESEQGPGGFDCNMAAEYVLRGKELRWGVKVSPSESLPLEEALETFGTPCGVQFKRKPYGKVFHSAVVLGSNGDLPTPENTFVYHKFGQHGPGEIRTLREILTTYSFDPEKHDLAFFPMAKEEEDPS